ncbi:MAG TPA: S1C family serine protease [Alphaproteobacteria bacterium]
MQYPASPRRSRPLRAGLAACLALAIPFGATAAEFDPVVLDAVVSLSSKVPSDARTANNLGTEREGNGVLIDGSGLVLTIGYLILEASDVTLRFNNGRSVPAKPVAYDHASGFGLVRAAVAPNVKPVALGNSKALQEKDPVIVAGAGGRESAAAAYVVSRRAFAGAWEYLLEDAVFTAPAYRQFGGAALFSTEGQLVGIGSLLVPNAIRPDVPVPGNMFVPIEKLTPIMADLLTTGRRAGAARPWLGVSTEEMRGRLIVGFVQPEGPAAKAGIKPGDLVLGVRGEPVAGLADFYRKMWAVGPAGATVPITILDGMTVREVGVRSIDRNNWLRINPSY